MSYSDALVIYAPRNPMLPKSSGELVSGASKDALLGSMSSVIFTSGPSSVSFLAAAFAIGLPGKRIFPRGYPNRLCLLLDVNGCLAGLIGTDAGGGSCVSSPNVALSNSVPAVIACISLTCPIKSFISFASAPLN